MSFIAGSYTATWAGTNIGQTRAGFRLRESLKEQLIESDDYGLVNPDGIQRGVETIITLDAIEYDLITAAFYTMAKEGAGTGIGDMRGGVGRTALGYDENSTKAKPLVLTPVAGTRAAATVAKGGAGQGVWTFYRTLLVGDTELLLSSRLRQGPVTFRAFPVPSWEGANAGKTYGISAGT
jgi:hypothetical protein